MLTGGTTTSGPPAGIGSTTARGRVTTRTIAGITGTLGDTTARTVVIERPIPEKFRNINGAFLKFQNLKALDPEYTAGRPSRDVGRCDPARAGVVGSLRRSQENSENSPRQSERARLPARFPTGPRKPRKASSKADLCGAGTASASERVARLTRRRRGRGETTASCPARSARSPSQRLPSDSVSTAARFGLDRGDIFEVHHTPLHTLERTSTKRLDDLAVVHLGLAVRSGSRLDGAACGPSPKVPPKARAVPGTGSAYGPAGVQTPCGASSVSGAGFKLNT